jgi:hypothetical protein
MTIPRNDDGVDDRPHVAIAEYLYRHEAEFAAGFLRDAEIPFRLQIDDAGGADAGVTIARPARIWVRAEDEEEARTILDLDTSTAAIARNPGEGAEPSGPSGRTQREGPTFDPLCQAERILAGMLALVLFGLSTYGVLGAVPWIGVWESIALGLALAFGLSAVTGKTLAPIKAILRALSGTLP